MYSLALLNPNTVLGSGHSSWLNRRRRTASSSFPVLVPLHPLGAPVCFAQGGNVSYGREKRRSLRDTRWQFSPGLTGSGHCHWPHRRLPTSPCRSPSGDSPLHQLVYPGHFHLTYPSVRPSLIVPLFAAAAFHIRVLGLCRGPHTVPGHFRIPDQPCPFGAHRTATTHPAPSASVCGATTRSVAPRHFHRFTGSVRCRWIPFLPTFPQSDLTGLDSDADHIW